MSQSFFLAFLHFVLDVLYYASPVFIIGFSLQALVLKTGNYKTYYKVILLILLRLTSLLLTIFGWIHFHHPALSVKVMLVPSIIAEVSLYALTLFLNQNINERIEADK